MRLYHTSMYQYDTDFHIDTDIDTGSDIDVDIIDAIVPYSGSRRVPGYL